MKRKIDYIRLALFAWMFFAAISCRAQIKGLIQGKLPNGLTYYIMRDNGNQGEVNFYLYQNVGAIGFQCKDRHQRDSFSSKQCPYK